ncbi:MAG: hypothetical protein KA715_04740 [Xanthomonadaceae bacterium]|nr:hypothetical protein [Xanthomonadaceae bacterium]
MLENVWTKFSDAISSQVWFQELKSKWEQLDSSQQTKVKFGSAAVAMLTVVGIILSFGLNSLSLKNELKNKRELLKLLSQANEEIKTNSNESDSNASKFQTIQWKKHIETLITQQMINPTQLEWKDEKRIASQNPSQLETWLEFKLNEIELRQLVKLSIILETNQPPLKVRSLIVDSSRNKGKVMASFAVSGFEVKP